LHGNDGPYYFPGTSTPPFNNTAFINAFAQSFTSFIINLDPNDKVDPTTITPHWDIFATPGRHTEMLFNKTTAGAPVVQTTTTSDALLQRCRYVFACDHRLFIIIKFPLASGKVSEILLPSSTVFERDSLSQKCTFIAIWLPQKQPLLALIQELENNREIIVVTDWHGRRSLFETNQDFIRIFIAGPESAFWSCFL
jgi:hypothetical protein